LGVSVAVLDAFAIFGVRSRHIYDAAACLSGAIAWICAQGEVRVAVDAALVRDGAGNALVPSLLVTTFSRADSVLKKLCSAAVFRRSVCAFDLALPLL
jgi:hypothetical protein